jgi:hypothetical protein
MSQCQTYTREDFPSKDLSSSTNKAGTVSYKGPATTPGHSAVSAVIQTQTPALDTAHAARDPEVERLRQARLAAFDAKWKRAGKGAAHA